MKKQLILSIATVTIWLYLLFTIATCSFWISDWTKGERIFFATLLGILCIIIYSMIYWEDVEEKEEKNKSNKENKSKNKYHEERCKHVKEKEEKYKDYMKRYWDFKKNNKYFIAYGKEFDDCTKGNIDEKTGTIINYEKSEDCLNRIKKGENYINWVKEDDEWRDKNKLTKLK